MKKAIWLTIILLLTFGSSLGISIRFYYIGLEYSAQYTEGFDIQLVSMQCADRHTYQMYQIIPNRFNSAPIRSVPTVIMVHGLASCKEDLLNSGLTIAQNGFIVFIPDIRGHGSHSGGISYGILDVQDMIGLTTWIEQSGSPLINRSQIGIYGHSMGAMIALLTAIKDPRIRTVSVFGTPANISQVVNIDNRLINELIGAPADFNDPTYLAQRIVVNHLNQTNPRNLLVGHGMEDEIVYFNQAILLNQTANPAGNRSDYQFLVYPHANHSLLNYTLPSTNITAFQDFLSRTILWYQQRLQENITAQLADVILFQRNVIYNLMTGTYKIMIIALTISMLPLWLLIYTPLLILFQKKKKKKINPSGIPYFGEEHDDLESERFSGDRELYRTQSLYLLIYLLSFIITGYIAQYLTLYSYLLKIFILPIIPLIPIAIIKIYQERKSPYLRVETLDFPHIFASLITSAGVLTIYNLLYDLFTLKIYATIIIVPFFLVVSTGFALSPTGWAILLGIFSYGLIIYLFWQQVWINTMSNITSRYKIKEHLLVHSGLRTFSIGLFAAITTSIGIFLFTIWLPDFSITLFLFPSTFRQFIIIIGFLLVFVMIILEDLAFRFLTRNIIGAALILAIIFTLSFISTVPRSI